jgi:ribonuclease HI
MGSEEIKVDEFNKIDVYSDGSGNTFDSDGGYGYIMLLNNSFILKGSGYAIKATNNTMEIQGAISGLQKAKEYIQVNNLQNIKVTLISDSQLVLGYATGRYQCKALHLTQLYIQLRQLFKELNAEARWVKGHSGNEHNEACDILAKTAREGKGILASKRIDDVPVR